LPTDDPWHRQPDISRARELLGWQPQTSLDDGLQHTARYFRARIQASSEAGSEASSEAGAPSAPAAQRPALT
jgi:UDP-glucuronate decarboxylase